MAKLVELFEDVLLNIDLSHDALIRINEEGSTPLAEYVKVIDSMTNTELMTALMNAEERLGTGIVELLQEGLKEGEANGS